MPRVDARTLKPYQIPNKVKTDPNKSFIERCHQHFDPTDTIQVRNVTNFPIDWWWLEEKDETYVIEDGSNVKIVARKDPGLWHLEPGEYDILSGSCAYVMMDALFKQTRALKTGVVLHPLDEGEIRNFALDDPQHQEEFINMVFEGKLTPQMLQKSAIESLGIDPRPRITEELPAIVTEESEYQRRMNLRNRGVAIPASLATPVTTQQAAIKTEEAPHKDLSDLQSEFDDQDPLRKEPITEQPDPLFDVATGGDPRKQDDKKEPAKEGDKDKENNKENKKKEESKDDKKEENKS